MQFLRIIWSQEILFQIKNQDWHPWSPKVILRLLQECPGVNAHFLFLKSLN